MTHPYARFGPEAFWRRAVTEPGPDGIAGLAQVTLPDKDAPIFTAGSCFAQHIGRAFAARGYAWIEEEPAPPLLSDDEARAFGFNAFSVRTGNIYTPSMLCQWLDLAFGTAPVADEFWHRDGRVHDPLRPMIEPDGFASQAEARDARHATLAAWRRAIDRTELFVFTLGLTEHWVNAETGLEYALCPGTTPGTGFDPDRHVFRNHDTVSTAHHLNRALDLLRAVRPGLRVLLTVSPVPLTATASGQHVLVATSHSKAVLRAVAGEVALRDPLTEYFPSYEIITNPVWEGRFFAPNRREVTQEGVDTVMRHVFGGPPPTARQQRRAQRLKFVPASAVTCEEAMLDAFA